MLKRLTLLSLTILPATGCSDSEILDVAATIGTSNAVGAPTTVYARVARSARTCWFEPGDMITKDHMFFAKVDPEAEGGRAEISVRKRRKDGRPGAKAFIVSLAPAGENTLYDTRNISLDKKTAAQMTRDVGRWANAELGCQASHKRKWAPVVPIGPLKKNN